MKRFYSVLKKIKFTQTENNDQVVLLLGWLGASPKHFQKYVDVYTNGNISSYSYIPPFFSMVRKNTNFEALKLLNYLNDNVYQKELIIHTMSGNGFNFWAQMVTHLSDPKFEKLKKKIHCIIIDSAPPNPTPEVFTRGFVGGLLTLFGYKNVYQHWLATPIIRFFAYYLFNFVKLNERYSNLKHLYFRYHPDAQYLFIYSKMDQLIHEEDIKKFIQELRDHYNPAMIKELYFKGSPHVGHLKTYPMEYQKTIFELINKK